MANLEHVEILEQGVDVWNKWRKENPKIKPDLEKADLENVILTTGNEPQDIFVDIRLNFSLVNLREANFKKVNLWGANLLSANLEKANLEKSILRDAILEGSNLTDANLKHAVLIEAILDGVTLDGADLTNADFLRAVIRDSYLRNTNFNNSYLGGTTFVNVDMSNAKNLETCCHSGPSTVDHQTLIRSGRLPDVFLKGVGWPDILIETVAPLFDNSPIKFYTCFISYSTKDEKFATRLHNDLQAAGIRCWKWDLDAKTGRDLWGEINDAIRIYDKLVLILSKNSLSNPHVGREIERAIEKENMNFQKHANGNLDGDPNVLFPVRLDDKIFDWDHHRKNDVTRKVIADAKGWNRDNEKYEKVLNKLIEDLKK